MQYLLMTLLILTSIFLILLVLVQRGRGGGLAGAFGGMGGQSAFGTKAGDLFTRITIGVAAFWILLCTASVKILNSPESKFSPDVGGAAKQSAPQTPGTQPGVMPKSTNSGNTAKPGEKTASPPAEKSEAPAPSAPAKGDAPAETPKAEK